MKTTERDLNYQRFLLLSLMLSAGILFLSGLWISQQRQADPLSVTVLPSVPQEGEPIILKVRLNNPLLQRTRFDYQIYGNGKLLTEGSAELHPLSTEDVTYVYPKAPAMGESVNFLVRSSSEQGSFEKSLSLPAYPPQVWSSFVSFASFSTSIMASSMGTSITSMGFYDQAFMDNGTLNVGLLLSLVLILLLVFLELSDPIEKGGFRLPRLRLRFGRLSAILFIVFAGMVLTKVAMILQ